MKIIVRIRLHPPRLGLVGVRDDHPCLAADLENLESLVKSAVLLFFTGGTSVTWLDNAS